MKIKAKELKLITSEWFSFYQMGFPNK
jgi:hypothetical protein